MKKKSKIRCLGQWVRIEHCDLTKANDDQTALLGHCLADKRLIKIEETLDYAEYDRVLRHEIFHMRLAISGLSQMEGMSEDLEEALATLAESKD